MSAQPTLLPGQSAPLAVITPTDHSGLILITAALGLTFAVVSLFIRAYVRYEFSNRYARDDLLVAAAMVGYSLIQCT